ncbi:DUF1573 domain-containing protein [Candidatus Woesearchaeota archaeon]|nr:DUF1573 domain-containing protein [Candidatus Woesearchaeota archaeon]
MKNVLIAVILLVLLGCTQSSKHAARPGEITPEQLSKQQIVTIIDVRSAEQFIDGHIAGAITIPLEQLSLASLDKAGIRKTETIVVYGQSPTKSDAAQNILLSFGYEDVVSLSGGFAHWVEDENPIERGAQAERPDTTRGAPAIELNATTHDFGLIPLSGGIVTTSFLITNKGTKDLTLTSLSTSCGCTSGKLDKERVAPGESALLTASFDPNYHKEPLGRFSRTVFIETNDPVQQELTFTIWVEIDTTR